MTLRGWSRNEWLGFLNGCGVSIGDGFMNVTVVMAGFAARLGAPNWVIGRLAGQRFASLDDLNTAVADQVTAINTRTPFRGQQISRKDLFDEYERPELLGLPESRWQPVTWRKSKVNRDYHIEIATVKYSVPHTFAGRHVDVKITGDRLTVMCDGDIIATHTVSPRQHVYVTDPDHVPDQHQQSSDLWSRAYFLRQAHKVGPHTVAAITSVLDAEERATDRF